MNGYGKAFGTFGELLQGVLPSNRNFLVTLPINVYSETFFSLNDETTLTVEPAHKAKTKRIVSALLTHFNLPVRGKLIIRSDIPEGKGMASSSADLVSAAKAVCDAYHLNLTNSLLEYFMADIEPSDGVMYEGIVSYYQKEAILRSYLGNFPSLQLMSVDEGGEVNTLEFHEKRKALTSVEKNEYAHLLNKMEAAIRKSDLSVIGKVATRSSILNQRLKKNPWFENMLEVSYHIKALGVVIAHSGTCLAIMLSNNPLLNKQLYEGERLLRQFSDNVNIYHSLSFSSNNSRISETIAEEKI